MHTHSYARLPPSLRLDISQQNKSMAVGYKYTIVPTYKTDESSLHHFCPQTFGFGKGQSSSQHGSGRHKIRWLSCRAPRPNLSRSSQGGSSITTACVSLIKHFEICHASRLILISTSFSISRRHAKTYEMGSAYCCERATSWN